ncbi:MAG: MFS transporter [Thermoleophilia bacterium]|nr:MFS transporter [Thermoleophilia bacterium]
MTSLSFRRASIPLADAGVLALIAFAAASIAAGLARSVTTVYLPLVLEHIRDAPGLIGTVMLINPLAGAVVPLVAGIWSDRLRARGRSGRLPFILGGSLLASGGLLAVALGHGTSYLVLAGAGLLAYVGINALQTVHRTLVADCFPPERRPRGNSAQEIAILVGSLVGITAGGLLVEVDRWLPFAVAALVVPLLAVPTLLRVREPATTVDSRPELRPARSYLAAARRPGVRNFLVAEVLWTAGYVALPSFFVLYADRVLGLSPATAAIWLAGFGVATGAAIVVGGRVREPARQAPLLALGVALMGGGFLLVAFSSQLWLVGLGLIPAAVGFGLISALAFPLLVSLTRGGEEGTYSALYHSVRALAATVALPAAGWTIAVTDSYRALFVFGGLVTLAALVPLLRACWLGTRVVPGLSLPRRLGSARFWWSWLGAGAAVWLAVLGFGVLLDPTPLQELDERLFLAVNGLGHGPDWLWDIFNPNTRNYVILVTLAFALALAIRPRYALHLPALAALSFGLAIFLMESIYWLFARDRPEEALGAEAHLAGHSWAPFESYPSGHAGATAALVTAITLGLVRMGVRPWLTAPLWLYLGAILFTRVLFGAHFPFDVLTGAIVGIAAARLVDALLETIGVWGAPLPDRRQLRELRARPASAAAPERGL